MTLKEFTIFRKEELVAFCKARFGKSWRRIVARQANMHPGSFARWKAAPPISLYRQINKLEIWARSIGFQSAIDEEVQAALHEHREFRRAAAKEIEEAQLKRNKASLARQDPQAQQIADAVREAMRKFR